jgi:IS30 family transposase
LITGAANRSAIGTLVERTTRYVLLVHLPNEHTASATRDGVTKVMGHLPAQLRRSLTWDQGKEMAGHLQITAATGTSVYFCEPHSPWQRGTNENTNGLLRNYFPKGTNLNVHSAERLVHVQDELNNRPRKTLGWKSPAAALAQLQSNYS